MVHGRKRVTWVAWRQWLSMEFGGGAQSLWTWDTALLGGVTDNCLALARGKEEGMPLLGEHGLGWGNKAGGVGREIQF